MRLDRKSGGWNPRRITVSLAAALAVVLFGFLLGRSKTDPDSGMLERGRYLVAITGCNDCHTPMTMTAEGPKPDMTMYLAGHPEKMTMPPPPKLPDGPWNWVGGASLTVFAGPWGTSYASNMTPDPETGMGEWTEEMFIENMRSGDHVGSPRKVMPPMPWHAYGQMSDDDLKAMFAYLQSIPAIKNAVPDYLPPTAPPGK